MGCKIATLSVFKNEKVVVPNEMGLICTNFTYCTEASPEVQSARCERQREKKKRNTKTNNIFALLLTP